MRHVASGRAAAWLALLRLAVLLSLPLPSALAAPRGAAPLGAGDGAAATASAVVLSQAAAAEASRWSPSWADGGFWKGRAWVWGWYRANPAVWSWWPAQAAAWGIGGLAGAAEISALVDGAIAARASQIAVPRSELRLDFGSVRAVRPLAARFLWATAAGPLREALADCQAGLLEGAPPTDAASAQLLNAACQVAYGSP